MRLATIRLAERTAAVRVDGDIATEIPGVADVGELLRTSGLGAAERANGPTHEIGSLDYAPLVPHPGKIICVGLNYRTHILEMKRDIPEYPTLFAKFDECLLGAGDEIVLPPESTSVDWEGELALVVGTSVRRASAVAAEAAIAGYTVANDVSMRDYQFRTREWLQGKVWEASTPVGPVLATPDEIPSGAELVTAVDGAEMQRGDIHDLVFGPVELVRYISTIITLSPGDVILTGTPGGVGNARSPKVFLAPGQTVSVSIDGIGTLTNRTIAEKVTT
ncbi:MAG TPA: fumarylacetoacetate hydrolase family protein [Pseudonocardiaceae bacterium]